MKSTNKGFKNRISKFSNLASIPHRTRGMYGINHDVMLPYEYRERYTAQSGTAPGINDAYTWRGAWWTEAFVSRPLAVKWRDAANTMCNDYPTFGGNYAAERCNAFKITVKIDPYVGANWHGVKVYILPYAGVDPDVTTIQASSPPTSYGIYYYEKSRIHKKMTVTKDVSGVKKLSMIIKPSDFNDSYITKNQANYRRTLTREITASDLGFMVLVVPINYTDVPETPYVAWQADITVKCKLYMSFAFRKNPDTTITSITVPADKQKNTKMTDEKEELSIFSNTKEEFYES